MFDLILFFFMFLPAMNLVRESGLTAQIRILVTAGVLFTMSAYIVNQILPKGKLQFWSNLHIGHAKNYYQLLELSNTNPTEKELKKAFRDASKKYHPDKNPGIDTTEIFIEVK